MLTLYRRLMALRRATPALSVGSYMPVEAQDDVLAYVRRHAGQRVLVALNLSSRPQRLELRRAEVEGQLVLSTHLDRADEEVGEAIDMRADEGVILMQG
jgi:alpha-glucosidase